MPKFEIRIEAERWQLGHWNPADDNTDVSVKFDDGTEWVALFISYQNLLTLRDKNRLTGECMSGAYFWAADMILVDEVSRDRIEQIVADLLQSGEFRQIFKQSHRDPLE